MKLNELSRTEIEGLVTEWIFSERDRKLLYRRLLDGIKIETLSFEFDLSETQVKRILKRCTARLAQHSW